MRRWHMAAHLARPGTCRDLPEPVASRKSAVQASDVEEEEKKERKLELWTCYLVDTW